MLSYKINGIPHREITNMCKKPTSTAQTREFGITYGTRKSPNNIRTSNGLFLKNSGDGAIVVRGLFSGRVAALDLGIRTFSSKAVGNNSETRGSVEKKLYPLIDKQKLQKVDKLVNMKVISNFKNLVTAYELIKSNPGNMTPGVDPATLDGVSKEYLLKIQEDLRAGKFEFGAARRVQIPKPGKKETRPLTIASPREKIVQKAIQLVLEPLFEPKFLECSHGFRPERGTRTAIQQLESKFQSAHYIIEADFSQAFPSIPHLKLMDILKELISCEKTLKLIFSGLKAGYVEFGKLHEASDVGTPQGSILSPLLCNIYLHQLDEYIEILKKKYEIGTKRRLTKEYMSLQNKAKY